MPGPFIHISAMRATAEVLSRARFVPAPSERINSHWTGKDTVELGRIMKKHPNFACLGAIGPDLFFFLPDFRDANHVEVSTILVTVLRFLEKLYEVLDPFITKYEKYLGPISEDTAEEISRLTGGLSETVSNISGELSSILITALEDFATGQGDLFSFFSLGHNKGWDEQAFLWSDMLHYRKTGQFGRSLWQRAEAIEDPEAADQARAYALGYLTHIAADVTGHALVNSISGGPFRLHWQRHHLVENHMDAFWYLADPLKPVGGNQYSQFTESALYYDIAFTDSGGAVSRPPYPTGNTLRENYRRRRLLDLDSAIPEDHPLPALLIEAMTEIFYQDGKHPKILRDNDGKPSEELIRQTYDLLFRFLKFTTVDGFAHEPPDMPQVFPNLDFPTYNDPNEDAPGDGGADDGRSWWDDFLDFILSIIKIILYILEVALWLATLPWAVLADIVTYPLRLGAYYALELPLFHILKNFRSVLVMTAYLSPMEDEIATGLIHVGTPDPLTFSDVLHAIDDIFPGLGAGAPLDDQPFKDKKYPYQHPEDEYKHPWEYPASNILTELKSTTAGPYPRGATPVVLFGDLATDPAIRDSLEAAKTEEDVEKVYPALRTNKHLGDPVSFSQYLIWLATRTNPQDDNTQVPMVDWNLDADRGYGYHCWDWNRHAEADREDPEGNKYQAPCTWPSQSTDSQSNFKPETRLLLHFLDEGLVDPGCTPGAPGMEALLVANPVTEGGFGTKTAIIGGEKWLGRVALTGTVSGDPVVVTLKSSPPGLLSLPATVKVPAGQSFADFTGGSVQTANETSVTVTASLGAVSKQATVLVSAVIP